MEGPLPSVHPAAGHGVPRRGKLQLGLVVPDEEPAAEGAVPRRVRAHRASSHRASQDLAGDDAGTEHVQERGVDRDARLPVGRLGPPLPGLPFIPHAAAAAAGNGMIAGRAL